MSNELENSIRNCRDCQGDKLRNSVFYEYFKRKISEGKTKLQAMVCIIHKLVNIIYGVLKNKTEYRVPDISNEYVHDKIFINKLKEWVK